MNNVNHKDNNWWRWLLAGLVVVGIIAASIWIAADTAHNSADDDDKSSVSTMTPTPTSTPTARPTVLPTAEPDATATPTPGNNTEGNEDTEEMTPDVDSVGSHVTISFKTPMFGHVSKEYAMDHLIYSVTMDYWHTHSGIDIEGSLGSAVKAAADGVVVKAEKDPSMGYTIVIDHGNGWQSTYANLASVDTVYTGQMVAVGDLIGTIGDSAAIEYAESAHLHFELAQDGVTVDPTLYLAGIN